MASKQPSNSPEDLKVIQDNSNQTILDDRLVATKPSTLQVRPATLGPCEFSVEEIHERFDLFYIYFHGFLPILNLPIPLGALQEYSPFLFWTIITISCRYKRLPEQHIECYEREYTSLAQKGGMTSPITLHTIQALLLICTWPVTAKYQLSDPSYLYCSAAIGGAGFLNLNRPAGKYLYQGSQVSEADLQNMSRTWLGLFCVCSSLEVWYGTPKFFRHSLDVTTLETHIERANMPQGLIAETAIIAVIAKHQSLVTPYTDIHGHDTLTDLHYAETDRLAVRYSAIWSDRLRFVALSVRLQLLTLSIIAWQKEKGGAERSHLAGRLATAIPVAIAVAETYESLLQTNKELSLVASFRILPKSYYRMLIYTAFFLVKFCCASELCSEQGRLQSSQTVARVRDMLSRCSERVGGPLIGDEPGRATECLDILLKHSDKFQGEDQHRIDDRGESSVVWDTLRQAYRLRGRSTHRTDLLEYIDPTNEARRHPRPPQDTDDPPAARPDSNMYLDNAEAFNQRSFVEACPDFSEFDWFWEPDFGGIGFV
jgi:hypothetical protein